MANGTPAYRLESFQASDGYTLQYRHYAAVGPVKAVVLCLHGIQSHAGWYEFSCTELAKAGYEVIFLDRRGSGSNSEARGDVASYKRLFDDLVEFLPIPRAAYAKLRIYTLAISWGGKLAVALEQYRPGLVEGLILLTPGFFPKVRPPFRQRLQIASARLVKPDRFFPIPLSDPELFTQTHEWLDFLKRDPLSVHQATARFLVESVRLDRYLRKAPALVELPVLLLLAGQDRIIDNVSTRAWVEQFASKDKTILEYPQAHHTLEFEPNRETFVRDILDWLNRHVCVS